MERVAPGFAQHWAELWADVAAQLDRLLPAFFRDVPAAHAHMLENLIRDGKKLRGGMVLAVCDALEGAKDRARLAAVAIECVQAATLIHDDVLDGDRTRRNRPATWTVHGTRGAVLLGDVIFATALQRTAESGAEEVRTLARAIAQIAAGAYRESVHERAHEADERSFYERVLFLKTGALFAAAAELGAIAAAAPPPVRRAAADFGARVGEAYQIADDLRDVVERLNGFLSPVKIAKLEPLLACFGVVRPTAGPIDVEMIECLRHAMQADIRRRVALALQAVAKFPEHARGRLETLPEAILADYARAPLTIAEP